jgi:hypothetical protein
MTYGGSSLMGKSDVYRRFANECLELAGTFRSPESQAVLLHMAQVWMRLADREEALSVTAVDDAPRYP